MRRRVGLESPLRPACPHPGGGKAFPRGTRGRPRNGVNDTRRSPMPSYKEFHRRSLAERDAFWKEQAALIDWQTPFTSVLDYSKPPFAKWFVGGRTNICHNAVDRHLATRPDAKALIYISTETDQTGTYTFRELHREVNRFAAALKAQGVGRGDRVLVYMPMIAEAAFAMLACARIGAIHSVVFGGFAAASLATRVDDAKPKVMITSDAGMRGGKAVPYKHLVDEAIRLSQHPPAKVIIVNRGLDPAMAVVAGRDLDYAALRAQHMDAEVPCEWLESSEPSYILYTSGTTGKPKGVQRDTGGYAVALTASMRHIFCLQPGDTMFTTSDIGWVVGHSYIVYGPLLNGTTTIMYEGLPIRPDPGIWWKIVSDHKVKTMFSSPTAIRVLKKQDPAYMKAHDISTLKYVFLAGEPLDEPTARWVSDSLGVAIIDNYWQTESGWPILSAQLGVQETARKFGSPSFPVYGYDVQLLSEATAEPVGPEEKGVLTIVPPLPPGCMTTIWGDDERFVRTYFSTFRNRMVYSTFDWATCDSDGYYFVLGRTDDVINVAGHRLGTREIEEAVQAHSGIAEVAVVGVADQLKGQVPVAFAVVKDPSKVATPEGVAAMRKEVMDTVDRELGAIARPGAVHFVTVLPKTRSGKLLRRSIQALAEGRDPGDLTTIEDPAALEQIRNALAGR
ncbi:MAG TPA: propionate--CoA ligase [Casimicrobiaceae bacterium]|nr:propionate--CoA ligase [Casimicrobiaceae bacterium]